MPLKKNYGVSYGRILTLLKPSNKRQGISLVDGLIPAILIVFVIISIILKLFGSTLFLLHFGYSGLTPNSALLYEFVPIILNGVAELNNALELADATLPPLFQNMGLALLSILIPLALAIFTDVYQKKGKEEADFCDLDLRVILDHVFRVKLLILFSIMVFLPFVFWQISNGLLRLTELILSSAGLVLTTTIILKIYSWTKGNISAFRFSYLRSLRNSADLVVAWRSVWKAKNVPVQDESEFFRIYQANIEKIVKAYGKRH